jgi:hypothetical protein
VKGAEAEAKHKPTGLSKQTKLAPSPFVREPIA